MAVPAQVVLESEPYHRLVHTWHSYTPELAHLLEYSSSLAFSLAFCC